MLEKLKGSQPLVMDRTTLDEHLGDEFDLYLKAEAKLLKKLNFGNFKKLTST